MHRQTNNVKKNNNLILHNESCDQGSQNGSDICQAVGDTHEEASKVGREIQVIAQEAGEYPSVESEGGDEQDYYPCGAVNEPHRHKGYGSSPVGWNEIL